MEEERQERVQEMAAERNRSLPTRLMGATPRFLEAFKQRLFSSLFLTLLVITTFSPVVCVLGTFGGVGFFVSAGVLGVQLFSIVVFLVPLIVMACATFMGIFCVAMAIMVTIKCINAIVQRIIHAILRVQAALEEGIRQVQAWYLSACRLVLDIYLNILRVIFFPFILAHRVRCVVFNAFYTTIVKPITFVITTYIALIKWFVYLPYNMVNGVIDAIMIVCGVQRTTKSQKSSRRGSYQDIRQSSIPVMSDQHHQPMNGKLASLPRIA
jgi:hypothetical protein